MALEDITKRILDDAKKEAKNIIKETEKKFKQALSDEEKKIKKDEKEGLVNAEEEAHEEVKRRIALARLESRNKVLAEKQELLEKVYRKALGKVQKLPPKDYKEVLKKIIIDKYIPETNILVLSSDLKNKDSQEYIAEINKSLRGPGLSLGDEVLPKRAGFILKGSEVEINSTWDVIMKSIIEENSQKVYQILFGND